MPINPNTELLLKAAAATSGDDTTATGGAKSATLISGGTPGELLPSLKADSSGVLDTNAQVQYQKGFWHNASAASDLRNARMLLKNGLTRPAVPGLIWVVTSHVDDAGKQVRFHANVAGAIYPESINTPSSPDHVSGSASAIWVERARLVGAISGLPVTATADIEIWVGNSFGSAEKVGFIPAGFTWATGEIKLGGVATIDDTGTTTNRRTAPGGVTFSRAYTYATGIAIRLDPNNDTLAATKAQGFWIMQSLQPGIPADDTVQYVWRLEGESGP